MIPTLLHYQILAGLIFGLGLIGLFVQRHNLLRLLLCIELMLLGVNTNLVAAAAWHCAANGQIYVLLLLVVGAAMLVVCAVTILLFYHAKGSIQTQIASKLQG